MSVCLSVLRVDSVALLVLRYEILLIMVPKKSQNSPTENFKNAKTSLKLARVVPFWTTVKKLVRSEKNGHQCLKRSPTRHDK